VRYEERAEALATGAYIHIYEYDSEYIKSNCKTVGGSALRMVCQRSDSCDARCDSEYLMI